MEGDPSIIGTLGAGLPNLQKGPHAIKAVRMGLRSVARGKREQPWG